MQISKVNLLDLSDNLEADCATENVVCTCDINISRKSYEYIL